MLKQTKQLETELKEQNKFLKHILESFNDLKKGRVKKFEFTE